MTDQQSGVREALREAIRDLEFLAEKMHDASDPERACATAEQYIGKALDPLRAALSDQQREQQGDPKPGELHPVDEAFYRLTIRQRDAAWREVEQLRAKLAEQQNDRERQFQRLKKNAGDRRWSDGAIGRQFRAWLRRKQ